MSAFDASCWPADMLRDVLDNPYEPEAGSHKDLTYDWRCAFDEAGLDPAAVASIERHVEGENDEADWLCFGTLANGRWFMLHAGCDYTGWDCRASGDHDTAATREELVTLKMTSEQRTRLLDGPVAP